MNIKKINELLSMTKFAIGEKVDIADTMIGCEPELSLKDWNDLIINSSEDIYIQSKNKKLYIYIMSNEYELYFIDFLERNNYFELLELCRIPIWCSISQIEKYTSHQVFNDYHGISLLLEVIKVCKD